MNRRNGTILFKLISFLSIFLIPIALVLLFWAGYQAYRIYIDYSFFSKTGFHFKENDKLTDLANTLSGTVGLILTLAGIITLLKTIQQTTKEMVETQKIMNQQLVQSTFFNLLKVHSETIGNLNLEGMDWYGHLKLQLKDYATAIRTNTFNTFGITCNSPHNNFNKSPIFQNAVKSILHIAELIQIEIQEKDREFYHKTFYYHLSEREKFLFGMALANELIKPKKPLEFAYTDLYYDLSVYKNGIVDGYFPPLYFQSHIHEFFCDTEYSKTELIKESITKATSYEIICNETGLKLEGFHLVYDTDRKSVKIDTNSLKGDLTEIMIKYIIPILKIQLKATLELYFHFNFQGMKFNVNRRYEFYSSRQKVLTHPVNVGYEKELNEWCKLYGEDIIIVVKFNQF